jgi:hypothetical protein
MKITLKSVQRILANYVLHYPEAGQNGESLVALANDYFEDLRDENVSDELFLIAARNARKVCRFFPKIADILVEVEKNKEKQGLHSEAEIQDKLKKHDERLKNLIAKKEQEAACNAIPIHH